MEEDQLKALFRNIDLDDPGASFTDDIMKTIEAQQDLNLHPALVPVIENLLLTDPGAAFSEKVMAGIQWEGNKTATPVITKKFVLLISGAVFLVAFLALALPHSNANLTQSSYFTGVRTHLRDLTLGFIQIAGTILLYVIPVCILLLVDYFFRARQQKRAA